jgi:glycosyltransferase involved in cell wall biosynthesis
VVNSIAAQDEPRLLVPQNDCADPVMTILVPTLDEERTIGTFIDWCLEGIAKSGLPVEIIIADSSKDRTPDIALEKGARVVKTPKRGLGRAYIDTIPFARGQFILMGDADCTYDFRDIRPFYDAWKNGAEFVMGSRFKGIIDDNAMPPLHRYFGTPVTTFILNVIFASRFSDIHCGMRGISTAALKRMKLRSQGWDYASEMVLKSVRMKLPTAEVPIHFHKDPEGRLSHMKRRGWMEPWRAGWSNLKGMFIYGVDFFLGRPGAVLFAAGLALLLGLLGGPLAVGGFRLSINFMLLGFGLAILGQSMLFSAGLAKILFDYSGQVGPRFQRAFSHNRTIAFCLIAGVGAVVAVTPLVRRFLENGYVLPGIGVETNWAIFGVWLIIAAFQTFIFALMIRALGAMLPDPNRPHPNRDNAA